MAKEKFPQPDEIAWGNISQVRVSSQDSGYSFEFDLPGKGQKMSISVQPRQTSFTLFKRDGTPIVRATQSGKEVHIFDFSSKLSRLPAAKKARAKTARKK